MPNTPTIADAKRISTLDILRKDLFLGDCYVHDLNYLTCANHCMRKKGDVVFSYNKPIY